MNAYQLNKRELLDESILLCQRFATRNNIPMPDIVAEQAPEAQLRTGRFRKWRETGHYHQGRIWVNLARCSPPARGVHQSWSFPGYKVDKTPYGVLAHEFGHWVDELLNLEWHNQRLVDLFTTSRAITNYEPVVTEGFAESMRLYLTNSDLLRLGSPRRYEFIHDFLCLYPVVDQAFDQVLSANGAAPNIIRAARNWTAGGQ